MCTNDYFDMKRFDKVIAKPKPCIFCFTVYFVYRLSFTPVLVCTLYFEVEDHEDVDRAHGLFAASDTVLSRIIHPLRTG